MIRWPPNRFCSWIHVMHEHRFKYEFNRYGRGNAVPPLSPQRLPTFNTSFFSKPRIEHSKFISRGWKGRRRRRYSQQVQRVKMQPDGTRRFLRRKRSWRRSPLLLRVLLGLFKRNPQVVKVERITIPKIKILRTLTNCMKLCIFIQYLKEKRM